MENARQTYNEFMEKVRKKVALKKQQLWEKKKEEKKWKNLTPKERQKLKYEKHKDYQKEYREKNREKMREYMREYRKIKALERKAIKNGE